MFMKYILESDGKKVQEETPKKQKTPEKTDVLSKPETILRQNGFKIGLVTPTSFGTQIDLAKSYKAEKVKEILVGYDIKIRGRSIFVMN